MCCYSQRARVPLSLSLSLSLFRALLLLSLCWVWSLLRVGSEGRFVLSKIFYFLRNKITWEQLFRGILGTFKKGKGGEIRSSRQNPNPSLIFRVFVSIFFAFFSQLRDESEWRGFPIPTFFSLSLSLSLSASRERYHPKIQRPLSRTLHRFTRLFIYTYAHT